MPDLEIESGSEEALFLHLSLQRPLIDLDSLLHHLCLHQRARACPAQIGFREAYGQTVQRGFKSVL